MNQNAGDLFHSLHTVSNLLSELALSVAAAQSQLDADYVRNLKDYLRMVSQLRGRSAGAAPGLTAPELLTLLQATAPARHQFTETTVEVRADLQMSTLSELGVSGEFGGRAGIFAVAVNAAYTRRSAYDHRAAATIRSVIHSVPASPGVMEKLLSSAASSAPATLPSPARYRELTEIFDGLLKTLPAPQSQTPATQPAQSAPEQVDFAPDSSATSGPPVRLTAGLAADPAASGPRSHATARLNAERPGTEGLEAERPRSEPVEDQPLTPPHTDSPTEVN